MSFGACSAMLRTSSICLRGLADELRRGWCRSRTRPGRTPWLGVGSELSESRRTQRGEHGGDASPIAATTRSQRHDACSRIVVPALGGDRRTGTVARDAVPSRHRPGFRYSRWDGTQVGFDLDADALLDEMTDDLLYHGDLNAALRRMMQQGFQDRNGEQLMGMREMLEKLRERRREELEQLRPRRRLRRHRRAARRGRRPGARRASTAGSTRPAQSGDQRRQEIARGPRRRSGAGSSSSSRPTSPGRVQALQQYDFMDDAARAAVRGADGGAARAAACRAISTRCPRACRT